MIPHGIWLTRVLLRNYDLHVLPVEHNSAKNSISTLLSAFRPCHAAQHPVQPTLTWAAAAHDLHVPLGGHSSCCMRCAWSFFMISGLLTPHGSWLAATTCNRFMPCPPSNYGEYAGNTTHQGAAA